MTPIYARMNSTSTKIFMHAYSAVDERRSVGAMGRARSAPKTTPSERSLRIAADYKALVKRKHVTDGEVLEHAQLEGISLTQPTLNRARNAALQYGPNDDTLRAIAAALKEPALLAFPGAFTTGNTEKDEIIVTLDRLPSESVTELLLQARKLLSKASSRVVTEKPDRDRKSRVGTGG